MAKEIAKPAERGGARRAGESDPLRGMIGLRDTINELFEGFFQGRPMLSSLFGESAYGERGWVPPVDICEAEDELVVYAGMPGMKKEDVHIEVQDGTLVLSGRCREPAGEGRQFLRHELACGEFYRAFSLPVDVKADQVKASFRDGVLEIHLPKSEGAKARRIQIE